MKKLIDAQTAYDVLTDYYHHSTDTQRQALMDALSRVPTVDSVPVIRCGFCRYYDSIGYCALHQTEMNETDFCSYGVKKDGDHHD